MLYRNEWNINITTILIQFNRISYLYAKKLIINVNKLNTRYVICKHICT